jgi:hypothetical protein
MQIDFLPPKMQRKAPGFEFHGLHAKDLGVKRNGLLDISNREHKVVDGADGEGHGGFCVWKRSAILPDSSRGRSFWMA